MMNYGNHDDFVDHDIDENLLAFFVITGALIEYAMILYKKQKVHHHRSLIFCFSNNVE